jgi:hypothetical protein
VASENGRVEVVNILFKHGADYLSWTISYNPSSDAAVNGDDPKLSLFIFLFAPIPSRYWTTSKCPFTATSDTKLWIFYSNMERIIYSILSMVHLRYRLQYCVIELMLLINWSEKKINIWNIRETSFCVEQTHHMLLSIH